MEKILTAAFCFLLFSISLVSAATFECAYDGTNCNKSNISFCPDILDSELQAFCSPKNSFTCEGIYDCAQVGGPTSTPIPGGPTSTPIPPSPTPAICSSLGTSWSCQPASLLGTFNCNATNPSACNPNDPPTCIGNHPNIYDDYCGSGFWCCGPSLLNTGVEAAKPYCNTLKLPSSFVSEDITSYVYTALGCIPYKTSPFVSSVFKWSTGIGGGVSFFVIIWGVVLIIINGHDPKKIQAGQEMITASISGMLMIIICLLLINYLGDKVLGLGPLGFRQ